MKPILTIVLGSFILISLLSCQKDQVIETENDDLILVFIPEITTSETFEIKMDSLICGGKIINDGNSAITEMGIVYGLSENPTIENNVGKIKDETRSNSFICKISNLQPSTNYHVRAYASNSKGTGYSLNIQLKTLNLSGIFTDIRDGNIYKWVKIGDQTWMAENMSYLPKIVNEPLRSLEKQRYYVYNYLGNDINEAKSLDNYLNYGILYNWEAAKRACPNGWHIPADEEWDQLAKTISNDNGGYSKILTDIKSWEHVGAHLKSKTIFWRYKSNENLNEYGFSALPGGYTDFDNSMYFYALRNVAGFWSTMEHKEDYIWGRLLVDSNSDFLKRLIAKEEGYSLRCIKD